jgi:hypothetical protein
VKEGMKKILMGWLSFLILISLSFNVHAQWVSVMPPEVSSSWGLNKIRILSNGTGWAVGVDAAKKQGVILRYQNYIWSVIDPPNVSSDWELDSFTAIPESNDMWAVGVDFSSGSRKGIMLHYRNGLWTIFTPPYVSLDWGLYDISFVSFASSGSSRLTNSPASTTAGWAWIAGIDYSSKKAILFFYRGGVWSAYTPPDLSSDWGLYGIYMIAPNAGWAVGVDHTNSRGALLYYSTNPNNISITQKTYAWQVVPPPQINGDWELRDVGFPPVTGTSGAEEAPSVGWAVGVNHTHKKGVLLYFANSGWTEVTPPDVSSDWELNSVYFPSDQSGWATGIDHANKKGIVLQYANGSWTTSGLPEVSSDWDLGTVHFINPNSGWAAGTNAFNKEGVLLTYSNSTTETISTPSTPNGSTSVSPNAQSTYSAGGSRSNLAHPVQYYFDWGDGTNSGWLPTGTGSTTKAWASAGVYGVRVQARDATATAEVSKWSPILSVTVSSTPSSIILLSPPDGTLYTGCSLYSLPVFTWNSDTAFSGYEIQFSNTKSFDKISGSDKTSSTSVTVNSKLWGKILTAPVSLRGPMFWRVIGTQSDKTTVISDTLSIFVDSPQAVGDLMISNPSKSSLPSLSWKNNCNIKFKVWFGSDVNFYKKSSVSLNIKNPDDNGGVFTGTLNSSQWLAIQRLVGRGSGSLIYWYVESWDGANRHVVSQPAESFILAD